MQNSSCRVYFAHVCLCVQILKFSFEQSVPHVCMCEWYASSKYVHCHTDIDTHIQCLPNVFGECICINMLKPKYRIFNLHFTFRRIEYIWNELQYVMHCSSQPKRNYIINSLWLLFFAKPSWKCSQGKVQNWEILK